MELMHGDIRDLMRHKIHSEDMILDFPFDLPEVVDIMLQIAEGMWFLRDKWIVHRGLKATNILVNVSSWELQVAPHSMLLIFVQK